MLAASVDDGLDLAALQINPLDRATEIILGLRSRHDHFARGNPAKAAIVADVHLAVGAEGCAIRAAGNLRDHLFPPVGINPRQPFPADFDQHYRSIRHDHRAFRKLQIGGKNADIGHESSRLALAQADFQAYFPRATFWLRVVMAKPSPLAKQSRAIRRRRAALRRRYSRTGTQISSPPLPVSGSKFSS